MTRKRAFETAVVRLPERLCAVLLNMRLHFHFCINTGQRYHENTVPTHCHSFTLWSTLPQARLLGLLSSKTLANLIMRLHAGLTSIAPPFPASSNILQNLVTPTFGNTSLVGPASSRSVMSAMVPFYLPALKLPMSLSSPKRPSLMSLALQWPGHYTSTDLSHMFVDPNPGFPSKCGQAQGMGSCTH